MVGAAKRAFWLAPFFYLALGTSAGSVNVNIPAAPPKGSAKTTVDPSFLGVSLELSYIDVYCELKSEAC